MDDRLDVTRYTQDQLSEKRQYSVAPPEGRLIAHRNRIWRVVAVSEPANDDGRGLWHWTLRPEHHTGPDEHFEGSERDDWRVLPAHHAICAECHEPVPCRRLREQWAAIHASRRARNLMSIPDGACWSCQEPITSRQRFIAFPGENLFLPAGPTVTFHTGRQECRRSAMEYQEKWVAADHTREPGPDTDLNAIMQGKARDTAQYCWYPSGLTSVQCRFLAPLIDAGLIVEPAPGHRGGENGLYRLTEEGWRTHRQYPPKAGTS